MHTTLKSPQEFSSFMGLIIRSSAIHAAGCYTTTAIRKGERVGRIHRPAHEQDQSRRAIRESPHHVSLWTRRRLGGPSTAIALPCSLITVATPNCETEEIRGRVWITAIRKIAAGEEITYDYCLYDGGDEEANCNCGAKKVPRNHVFQRRNAPAYERGKKGPHLRH